MVMQKNKMKDKRTIDWKIILVLGLLIVLTFATSYYGSSDIGDYADTAKYFAGDYSAKIRNSHSYLFGFIHAPLISLFGGFVGFKITSLIFLILIVLSIYEISGRNKRALWLSLLSPVVWFMAPWINPIQLSSLLFLWAYYFIKKYRTDEKISHLISSGILIGLSWAFWDAIIFFGLIFAFAFLYDKKALHVLFFAVAVMFGLLPKLILDQVLFGFAFMGLLRYAMGQVTSIFFSGIYGNTVVFSVFKLICVLFFIPLFSWKLFSKKNWKSNRGLLIFLTLSLILIVWNSQIRYVLLIAPIILVELVKILNDKQIKKQIVYSIVIIILVSVPYVIQIGHSSNSEEFKTMFMNIGNISIYEVRDKVIQNQLIVIEKDYPNQTFVVGNAADDYQQLAHAYWGSGINEFVSIQDYKLWKSNNTILFEKDLDLTPRIDDRRQIFISAGMKKSGGDQTNYENIKYGLGFGEPLKEEGFKFVKRYGDIYLSTL